MKDNLLLSGNVKLTLTSSDGKVKNQVEIPNLVVKTGRDFIASRMITNTEPVMSHMAIGTGNTAPVANNTTLDTEVARVSLVSANTLPNPDENRVVYYGTFGPDIPVSNAAVVEAGIFNANTGGDMLCRTIFPLINKTTDDTLSITWTIIINAS